MKCLFFSQRQIDKPESFSHKSHLNLRTRLSYYCIFILHTCNILLKLCLWCFSPSGLENQKIIRTSMTCLVQTHSKAFSIQRLLTVQNKSIKVSKLVSSGLVNLLTMASTHEYPSYAIHALLAEAVPPNPELSIPKIW